jgi:hypothetical protein
MILSFSDNFVYVALGIDGNEHDQVLSIFQTFEDAKKFCASVMHETEYYDLWIEKHPVM